MFTFPDQALKSGPITKLLEPFNIFTFHEAVRWVWKLPYGRNSERSNYLLVPVEQKGACSTKHAFLAELAIEQSIPLTLKIGIFMMNFGNTPGIGSILKENGLNEIPEAHCYLNFQGKRYDFTSYAKSTIPYSYLDFEHEETILSNQIGAHKVETHKHRIKLWAQETNQKLSLEDLWSIREQCIKALS